MRQQGLVLGLFLALSGCAKEGFGPVAAPKEEHPAYAATFPEQLETTNKLYGIERDLATEFSGELAKYPEALTEPDWEKVQRVYELADEDGQSAYYAEVRKSDLEVAKFFVEEKKEIVQKVSGGVQYQAEQEKCDAKFYGSIDRGLEKAVTERLEDREDAASAAQTFITQNEERIGKKNVEVLRDQARQIAAAANRVYVSLPERHVHLEKLVSQGAKVEKTVDRRLEELKESSPTSDAEKAAHEQELTALTEARVKIAPAVEQGKSRLKSSEENLKAAQKQYDEALSQLVDAVAEKAKAAQKPKG
jgi:hypothetical protein